MRIFFCCVLILTASYTYAQMQDIGNIDRQIYEARKKMEQMANDLVSEGIITQDQMDSILGSSDSGTVDHLANYSVPDIDDSQLRASNESADIQQAVLETDFRMQQEAAMVTPQNPTLTETLDFLSKDPNTGHAHRNNYSNRLNELFQNPTAFEQYNESFSRLSLEKKKRVLKRIAGGKSLESAFGRDKPVFHKDPIDAALEARTPLQHEYPVSDNNSDPYYNQSGSKTRNIILFLFCAIFVGVLFAKKIPFVNRS